MRHVQANPITSKKRGCPALWLLVALASVLLDQLSKRLVCSHLKGQDSVVLIPGILRMTYVENRGAAFGSFSNHRWVFMILSTVAIIAMTAYLLFLSENHRGSRLALALIIGGGIGNMIDRIAWGYVVDFIDFYAFPRVWTWIFNVADCCVCVGVGLFFLFYILTSVRELRKKEADTKSSTPPPASALPGSDATGCQTTCGGQGPCEDNASAPSSEFLSAGGAAVPGSPEHQDDDEGDRTDEAHEENSSASPVDRP